MERAENALDRRTGGNVQGGINASGWITGSQVYDRDNRGEHRLGRQNTANIGRGWWKCGDTGLIIQWGIAHGHIPTSLMTNGWAESSTLVTFPIQFPNRCISLSCSLNDGGTQNQWVAVAQFNIRTRENAGMLIQTSYMPTREPSATYIAIGY
ncbi:hypothetical protein ID855_18130 [Xenorhabdus sp. ZM]|uniref:gp53-like domain-containing protein n=1 Tax=Xenorhabdus szentirmaii TaxID=290112 RepID=UPI0019C5A69F|nr:hypothetical protein [Xenorhabdus sp. ZM]MBD2806571.1 hypothetical protein [Xenorhabdus sp. ZM]